MSRPQHKPKPWVLLSRMVGARYKGFTYESEYSTKGGALKRGVQRVEDPVQFGHDREYYVARLECKVIPVPTKAKKRRVK